jgi:hypothetical protein
MERGEDEMAGHRRLDRDRRGLWVAHLADQEHVRVGAEDRPEPAREAEAALGVDLDLVDAVEPVLDRVLDRHHDAIASVQVVEGPVQGRRLPGAGRPADDDGAVGLFDRGHERGESGGLQLEVGERRPVWLPPPRIRSTTCFLDPLGGRWAG